MWVVQDGSVWQNLKEGYIQHWTSFSGWIPSSLHLLGPNASQCRALATTQNERAAAVVLLHGGSERIGNARTTLNCFVGFCRFPREVLKDRNARDKFLMLRNFAMCNMCLLWYVMCEITFDRLLICFQLAAMLSETLSA